MSFPRCWGRMLDRASHTKPVRCNGQKDRRLIEESQRWMKEKQQKQQLFTVQGSERFKKISHSGK